MKITAVCSPLLLVSWLAQQLLYDCLNVYFKMSSGADPENLERGKEIAAECKQHPHHLPPKTTTENFPSKDGWSIFFENMAPVFGPC